MHDVSASEIDGVLLGLLAAPSSASLAASMKSIVFSAPWRKFIWIGGNLRCKSNYIKFWLNCRQLQPPNQCRFFLTL
jgi:hypothetical protein